MQRQRRVSCQQRRTSRCPSDSCLDLRSEPAAHRGEAGPRAGCTGRGDPLYSRGQRADVLVATERQAHRGKGSALVEHFCHLGGQVAGGSHEHLPEVARPGGGLLLRSASRRRRQTHRAGRRLSPSSSRSHRGRCQPGNLLDSRAERVQETTSPRNPGDVRVCPRGSGEGPLKRLRRGRLG